MTRIGDQRRLVNDNKTVKEIMKATGRSKSTVLKFSKLIEDWVSTEDDLPQKDPKYKNLSIEVEVKIKKVGIKQPLFIMIKIISGLVRKP